MNDYNNSDDFHLLIQDNSEHVPIKQRCHANARERYRTHRWDRIITLKINKIDLLIIRPNMSSNCSVNSAFSTLRLLIPTEPHNRKLSKIETLRLAKSYIAHLGAILMTGNKQFKSIKLHYILS